jgi:hypothetical protein
LEDELEVAKALDWFKEGIDFASLNPIVRFAKEGDLRWSEELLQGTSPGSVSAGQAQNNSDGHAYRQAQGYEPSGLWQRKQSHGEHSKRKDKSH